MPTAGFGGGAFLSGLRSGILSLALVRVQIHVRLMDQVLKFHFFFVRSEADACGKPVGQGMRAAEILKRILDLCFKAQGAFPAVKEGHDEKLISAIADNDPFYHRLRKYWVTIR